jgi:hypothetical protein
MLAELGHFSICLELCVYWIVCLFLSKGRWMTWPMLHDFSIAALLELIIS